MHEWVIPYPGFKRLRTSAELAKVAKYNKIVKAVENVRVQVKIDFAILIHKIPYFTVVCFFKQFVIVISIESSVDDKSVNQKGYDT